MFHLKTLKTIVGILLMLAFLFGSAETATKWKVEESEHFRIVFKPSQSGIVHYILESAEEALSQLSRIFQYLPSEKIVIRTSDFSDYGSAGATSIPHNFIRLEIEPLELGYENTPFDERLKWLISHELVHIVVNDLASGTESFGRRIFSKVPPERDQPLSIFYSLVTNSSRYTPRWHQEGIAAFMETWLNGGYGRLLGNFDEMYFRALFSEGRNFPTARELDTRLSSNSFLLGTLHYLYGTRLASFLAERFGTRKLIHWYRSRSGTLLGSYTSTFEKVFGLPFSQAWQEFAASERDFQMANIESLQSVPRTKILRLQSRALGWVTQPYIDNNEGEIIFGHHAAHQLTSIQKYSLRKGKFQSIGDLPAPSIIQVASTAYDAKRRSFFYTTKNNQLYRDIWELDVRTRRKRKLFTNSRIGNLAVSPENGELWGVRHSAGRIALIYSPYPYDEVVPTVQFEFGDILQHLAVSPTGKYLAATLHQASGRQAVIVADIEKLKTEKRLRFTLISEEGSPEFPSWSADEEHVYWNAFTNGVSNIYRSHRRTAKIEAMSHTIRGLFRPLLLSSGYIFAFEFSTEGFLPVIIASRPAEHLPAVQYRGQRVVEKDPGVTNWVLDRQKQHSLQGANGVDSRNFNGLAAIKLNSFFPVISGFKNQEVVGLYAHFSDPLATHDIVIETGYSPFSVDPGAPRTHLKATYGYKNKIKLGVEHNAASFYDLVNDRKAGLNGTIWSLEHTKYWRFDNPQKIKQISSLVYYTGIEAINDNLIKVTFDDFILAESAINAKSVRRAIGSVDSEFGNDLTVTFSGFGISPSNLEIVGGSHLEWSHFRSWAWPHNVLHFNLVSGYRHTRDNIAVGNFYLGGFGNRGLEYKSVKQYRDAFRFPGTPIYSLPSSRFARLMLEHNLPPLRVPALGLGPHQLEYVDVSWYSQVLLRNGAGEDAWWNLGGQINLVLKHWANLETTLSAGFANAWNQHDSSREWFISFKLLRD